MGWRDHRNAPVVGSELCPNEAIPLGGCKELRYGQGDAALSLLLYRGEFGTRAYVNQCPHFSLPLNARPDRFLMLAGARIMCAYHSAVFRLDDGQCIEGPAQGMGLEPVSIAVKDDVVVLTSA